MTFRRYNPCYVGTWNIHTLCGNGNKEILLHQLRGYNWHVTGLGETHITGKGEYGMEEGIKLIYSGKEKGGEAWCGVRFLLNWKAAEALIASHLISAQIISIWLSCQGMKATFIQEYTPTADSSDDEINSYYNDLQITLYSIPKRTMFSFWETLMLRLVFTSPYRKIPWANLVLAI